MFESRTTSFQGLRDRIYAAACMDPDTAVSFCAKTRDQAKWVLKKTTIEGLTRKLEKLQNLLGLAVNTSTG